VQKLSKIGIVLMLGLGLAGGAGAAGFTSDKSQVSFDALDMDRVAAEDALTDPKGNAPYRFAIGHEVKVDTAGYGVWATKADGNRVWTFEVQTPDAAHLNFGFNPYRLPAGASLLIRSPEGKKIGPYTDQENSITGQFWTPVLLSGSAVLELTVPAGKEQEVELQLVKIGHGYRGFGATAKHCKSGACNMDVACLGGADPWNEQRRSVGAYTLSGTDTCTGSLVNNTANNRRMLFATAGHCNITSNAIAATIVTYWNYESPTCRTPGSSASGQVVPRPSTISSGATFLARTGSTSTADWSLIEFVQPANPAYNHYWAGWDRTGNPVNCSQPGDPASTAGLCASIHHPGVDEKRITFIQQPMDVRTYLQPTGTGTSHWYVHWDPNPPLLPGIQPPPASVVPNVTEGGSSGSPLYDVQHRLVGVLSGGLSACGATGENLTDYYGRLAIAWEGGGTTTTAMKTHLDPVGGGTATTLDGIGMCTAPAAPTNVAASATAANQVTVNWTGVVGLTKYRVLRSTGTCPGSSFAQIAEVDNATTYVDNTVSGGSTYSYKVVGVDTAQPCESAASSCSSATATGQCTLAPGFAGATSAASNGTPSCATTVNWAAATPNCGGGGQLRFNIYRSTNPVFTPSLANALALCQSGTSYVDSAVAPATAYHYIVRAEDSSGSGSGTCAAGLEDTNTVVRSATPAGPESPVFTDDVESGTASWTVAGTGSAGANFAVVTTQSHSPTRSWFTPDPNATQNRTLTMASPIALAAGGTFEFWHRYSTEADYDGGVLEYSLNGGTTWTDILAGQGGVPANPARFVAGGYNGIMDPDGAFGGVAAWHGVNTTWTRVAVNLADFAGRTVTFRFRAASDGSVAGTGWWIDDVRLLAGSACTFNQPDAIFADDFEP